MRMEIKQPLRQIQQRYCIPALLIAATIAALLLAAGFRAMGKGLMLGVLFSVVNFTAMAVLLPMQFNRRRNQSVLMSLVSILLRYGLMAIPLIVALNSSQFALSAVAVGLFGVPITILGDHLWTWLHSLREARH